MLPIARHARCLALSMAGWVGARDGWGDGSAELPGMARARMKDGCSRVLFLFVFSDQDHAVGPLIGITGVEGHSHLFPVLMGALLNAVNLGFA